MFIRLSFLACAAAWFSLPCPAQAQTFQTSGSDFLPRVVNDQIVTDSHNDPQNFNVANVRVSPYVFGLIDGDPYFTQDPGFNAPAGSNLPGGGILSFNIDSHLFYWNGIGKVTLSAPPAGESLQYTFGINTRTISGATGASADAEFTADAVVQPGFFIGTVNPDGSLHKHLNAFLLNSAGSADPGSTPPPSPGVYFASIELTDSVTSIARSPQLYVLYSEGMNTCQQVDARVWLRDHYAPGTNLVFAPGAGDINLDGKVNFTDLVALAANYGSNNAAWCDGDLNSDGKVNFADLVILAAHYGASHSTNPTTAVAASFPADGLSAPASVPEPAAIAMLLPAAILARHRPRGKEGRREDH